MTGYVDAKIAFADVDKGTANEFAGELAEFLTDELPGASVTRQRDDPLTQDFGATLAVILGSAAVTALAKGIAAWLARRHEAVVVLQKTDDAGNTRKIQVNGQIGARTERVIADFLES